MQHCSIDDPASYRLHQLGMWNAVKVAAEISINYLSMSGVDQLVDVLHLRSPLGLPVLRLVSSAYMPSPLSRQVRGSWFARLSPSSAAFPVKKSGRLLQLLFRDLLSVHLRYGLHARGIA